MLGIVYLCVFAFFLVLFHLLNWIYFPKSEMDLILCCCLFVIHHTEEKT